MSKVAIRAPTKDITPTNMEVTNGATPNEQNNVSE